MDIIDKVVYCLPEMQRRDMFRFFSSAEARRKTTEIRFRANMPSSVTYAGKNIYLFGGREIVLSESDMRTVVSRLCEESLHTYASTINEGYITLSDGLRIGVCGRARSEGACVAGVCEITSVCVRIPHEICGVSAEILPILSHQNQVFSTLFYSPPGIGKTTLVRDIAARLGGECGRRRVCVVDSRGEIYMRGMFSSSLCDVLAGYPKGRGIEIATRTLSPEAIVCDEIGDGDADGILASQNSGVPLIATAHGGNFASLLLRPCIKKLYDANVFRYYIGIKRAPGEERFAFDIRDSWRKIE